MPETLIDPELVQRAAALRDLLGEFDDAYHNSDEPRVDDPTYDALRDELSALEEEYPDLRSADSPTQRVGAPPKGDFPDVTHRERMLSLGKTKETQGVRDFAARFPGATLAVQPKLDGLSLLLTYTDGVLTLAATRGDGNVGKDVTKHITHGIAHGYIAGISTQIVTDRKHVEVRGEVIMRRSVMAHYNATRASGERELKHERNAAAGALVLKDRERAARTPLEFVAFDLRSADDAPDLPLIALDDLGFEARDLTFCSDIEQALAVISEITARRPSLDFLIDGIVIRLADPQAMREAGATSSYPHGAIALKFPAQRAITRIVDVEWRPGRTGKLVPRAILEPVKLDGRTMEHASLANISVIRKNALRLNIPVVVQFAQDIIPQIIGPAAGVGARAGDEILPPEVCSSCGHATIAEGKSDERYCSNVAACPGQLHRRLVHWAGRDAADIDGLSGERIQGLIDAHLVERVSDLYRLTYDDLMPGGVSAIPGLAEKSATKLLAAIDTSRSLGLRRAFIGFSIPLANKGTAERLCLAGYEDVAEIGGVLDPDEIIARLRTIKDIGDAVAGSIAATFVDEEFQRDLGLLREYGVDLSVRDEDRPVTPPADSAVAGKKYVVTGTMETMTRSEIEKALKVAGASTSGSVSKNTNVLVVGPGAGGKLAKAEALVAEGHDIEIIDEAEVLARLGVSA